jgi:hypothetical protein
MTGKIFINYRRGDDAGHTGRLFDRLQDVFPPEQLFLDVDNIAPGLDFVRVLNERVAECDIVLAVIGKGWLEARDSVGKRRLDDPDDFVRIEITSALNQGKRVIPVLVGEAQMPHPEQLPEALQLLARRNAVRLTHERFRADMQGLVKAIQQGLAEIDAQRKAEAEAARHVREEEERRLREIEAARRDEQEALKKKSRDDAYRHALTSDDLVLLRSFIVTYDKGSDVNEIRARLRALEPREPWLKSRQATIVAGAVFIVMGAGAAFLWSTQHSAPTPKPANASTVAPGAAQTVLTESKARKPPLPPDVDAVAWSLLKDTTDDAALKRFIEQYPQSEFRRDAEARMAGLAAARAARAEAVAKADAAAKAEAVMKTEAEMAARLDAANKALEAERAKLATASQPSIDEHLASLAQSNAEQPTSPPLTEAALVQAIKMELTRVGCYSGTMDDDWTAPALKRSIVEFVRAAKLPRAPDHPSTDFLSAIRNQPARVCPLECAKTEIESNGKCVAKACPSGQKLDRRGDCQTVKQRSASKPPAANAPAKSRPAPAAGTATGAVAIGCGRFGCKEHPVVTAPAGLPCKHAWQGRHGGWQCTD